MKATITNIEFEVLTGFANQDFQNFINAHAEALQYAYPLYIGKDGINVNQKLPRCYGFSIRPVSD